MGWVYDWVLHVTGVQMGVLGKLMQQWWPDFDCLT